MSRKIKVGLIGGSGLDNPDILKNRTERPVTTIFGDPSDVLIEGNIDGLPCALLARHGREHNVMPGNVNYRANIMALKEAGCTHIIASTATGSLQEEIKPGNLIILDNFIDRTQGRKQTFHDGEEGSPPGIFHLPMEPAFSEPLRQLLCETADELGLEHHKQGTVVAIEGPRFSSKAESFMFRQWGGSVINMTTVPEVVLAKEAGILYAAIALATDYDCWKEGESVVSHRDVLAMFSQNVNKVIQLMVAAVKKVGQRNWDKEIEELDVGLMGGCGLEKTDIIQNKTETEVTTVYGTPADVLVEGDVEGYPVAFMLRHGKTEIIPGRIPYRANVWVLKQAGCTHVVAFSSCGSLKEEIQPGHFVIMDSFLDHTVRDPTTYHDGDPESEPNVLHIPMEPAFCVPLSQLAGEAADELGIDNHKTGTVVTIQGPRFSTKAESKLFQSFGADIINMTTVPEVILAKEAGMLYAAIALITNYDSWKGDQPVPTRDLMHSQVDNSIEKIGALAKLIVVKINSREWDEEINELKKLICPDTTKACGCPVKKKK